MRSVLRDTGLFSLDWLPELSSALLAVVSLLPWKDMAGTVLALCSWRGWPCSSLGKSPVDGLAHEEVPGTFCFPVNLQCCLKACSSQEHALEARAAFFCAPATVSSSQERV